MKILFLHISDMHIKSSDAYMVERAKKIISAVKANVNCDEIIVMVTGDIASSCKKDEYVLAKKFFGTLINQCKWSIGKKPKIFMVPGNHDMDFNNVERSRADVLKIANSIPSDKVLEEEYKRFNLFWGFSKLNSCFDTDKEVEKKIINLGQINIQINLINSALFSTYKDVLKDSDDGLHFISLDKFNIVKRDSIADYAITLMHHPEEYFKGICRNEIKLKLLNNSDIVLLGHDHNATSYEMISDVGGASITVRGGEFGSGNILQSSFGAILLDTDTNKVFVNQYIWQKDIYCLNSTYDYNINKTGKNSVEFQEWLTINEGNLIVKKIDDYFVFPRLRVKKNSEEDNTDKDRDIVDFENFRNIICDKRVIEISGAELSGKTTLLKHLYAKFQNFYTPLFITETDICGRIENIIRNAFERQYTTDNISFQNFLQKQKEEKIIFIDNIAVFESNIHKKMLAYLLDKYDKIIYTTNTSSEFNIKKELEEVLLDSELSLLKMKIEPFYSDKRVELIRNICQCIQHYNDKEKLEKDVADVNKFIKNQLNLFSLNPEFIIMFTRSFVLKMVENSSTNAFNAVFSNNIAVAIEKNKKKTNVQDNLIILQELAQFVHFNEKYPVQIEELKLIVEKFNAEHRTKHFYLDVRQELVDAKIIKAEENSIEFYNKTYLAYFVAKWLNRQLQNGKGVEQLKHVVDRLCYNINSDILLFLTYITENVGALYKILESEIEYTQNLEEYSIDKNDISLLTAVVEKDKVKIATSEEKKRKKEQELSIERSVFEKEEIRKVNMYAEEINEFTAKEMRLIKYLELISKILPCFYHLLDVSQQDLFVKEIYKLPNKIAYYLFEPLESNKEEFIDEMLQFVQSRWPERKYNKETIKGIISRILADMLLTIYNASAQWSATDRTINALDSFDYKSDSTYFIQNIMMHENLRVFRTYIERSDELFDNTKSLFVKYLLKRVFRKHCMYNNIEYKGASQKYVDKYLGKQNVVVLKLSADSKK